MPQVHNRSILVDGNAFGKNSRFMNTLKFSDITKRRVRAFNVVESKLNRFKLNYYSRQEELEYNRHQRQKEELLVKMKRMMAHKIVVQNHNLSTARDYYDSLNEDRSPRIIQKEVKEMLKQISPQYMREKRAKEKIEDARKRCDEVINKNRKQIDVIYPPPKQWQPYREEPDTDRSNATTPASPPPEMNPELRMRRLTLPQRRPLGVSRAFVMEKSNLGEKLEKEKTIIEKQIDDETTMPATTRSAPPQESKPDYDLPPVIVRKSSFKEVSQKTKSKRTDNPNYTLAPVKLNKKIKPELMVPTK